HRRIADAEDPLHLLDGSVAADEGCHEDLVLEAETGELGEIEAALEGDAYVDQADPLDDHGAALREPGQLLPVLDFTRPPPNAGGRMSFNIVHRVIKDIKAASRSKRETRASSDQASARTERLRRRRSRSTRRT